MCEARVNTPKTFSSRCNKWHDKGSLHEADFLDLHTLKVSKGREFTIGAADLRNPPPRCGSKIVRPTRATDGVAIEDMVRTCFRIANHRGTCAASMGLGEFVVEHAHYKKVKESKIEEAQKCGCLGAYECFNCRTEKYGEAHETEEENQYLDGSGPASSIEHIEDMTPKPGTIRFAAHAARRWNAIRLDYRRNR